MKDHVGHAKKTLVHLLSLPNLESIKGDPRKVVEAIDEYSKSADFPTNQGQREVVLQQLREKIPTVMVAVGGHIVYSVLCGGQIKNHNQALCKHGNMGRFYNFEANDELAAIARQLVELAGLGDTVEIISGPAGRNLPAFQRKLTETYKGFTSADLILIGHRPELYVPDLRVLESCGLICPGTTIIADDIYGVPGYSEYVQGSPQERYEHNMEKANVSNKECDGRWNLIYESKTVSVEDPSRGEDALEVTHCVSLLSG